MKHKPTHYYAPVLLNTQTAPQLLFLTRQSQVEQVNALHTWMTQPRQRGLKHAPRQAERGKRRFEAETRRSPGITEIDAATRNF